MEQVIKISLVLISAVMLFSCGAKEQTSGETRDWRKHNDSLIKALNDSLDALPVSKRLPDIKPENNK